MPVKKEKEGEGSERERGGGGERDSDLLRRTNWTKAKGEASYLCARHMRAHSIAGAT